MLFLTDQTGEYLMNVFLKSVSNKGRNHVTRLFLALIAQHILGKVLVRWKELESRIGYRGQAQQG